MITIKDLHKDYRSGKVVVPALRGFHCEVDRGEFVSVVGPSGCGKSTLLYVLGGMLRATSGSVVVDGFEVTAARNTLLSKYRRHDVGFVFQKFNLISSLSVYGNLKIAVEILQRRHDLTASIDSMLKRIGLWHKRHRKPLELSQGEQQRVAIARALVRRPKLLLADEPTGNLDSENSTNIMQMFREASNQGQSIVMITHNRDLAAETDSVIEMKDGKAVAMGAPGASQLQSNGAPAAQHATAAAAPTAVAAPTEPNSVGKIRDTFPDSP